MKVNASVDEQIAELLSALSLFPRVCTFESCQGHDARTDYGRIYFRCGSDMKDETAKFVCGLAPALIGLCGSNVDISLCWEGFWEGMATATLRVQGTPKQRRNVARVLRRIARQWAN